MNESFEIAGHMVLPGTVDRFGMPVARLFTQQALDVPLIVVHGVRPGPTLWLTAAIHGDEINGAEVIRRVLGAVDVHELTGTILAIPVVNVFGFVQHSRYLPDRRDLNRSFPGSERGSLASQIANLLLRDVVSRCDYGIDLHAGSDHRTNLPQARGNFDDPRVLELARVFGAPLALHAGLRSGSLRHAAAKLGIPCLLYEAGEPLRFERNAVDCGTNGVLRVLAHLGMLAKGPAPAKISPYARTSYWTRASRAGVAHLNVELGDEVLGGDQLGVIRDTFGDLLARIKVRHTGTVIAHTLNPLVNRGDALVHVAQPLDES